MAREDAEDPEEVAAAEAVETDWRTRPFAKTFDLIAAEYGWTDDQILDLTFGRIRQIREIVLNRQAHEWRRSVRLEEAKLKHIVSATHAAAGNQRGMRAADKIALLPPTDAERVAQIPTVTQVSKFFPVDPEYGTLTQDDLDQAVEDALADERLAAEIAAIRGA